ncbi:WcaF family extracellular polysaccharide biosynthesis acetyltransferase [Arthrobacter sp. Soil782]|uniref:WcaF family extracellular polysaccharide biosynthesis acetyltransferase n=1 Tax=Arthrobacter sp. Soil782 TaxID=1736410 RepID=UPI000A8BF37C
MQMSHFRHLSLFTGNGYVKGRSKVVQVLWVMVSSLIVQRIWCPSRLRVRVLRAFGANIGNGVLIREGVRVHWPWKLSIGDNSWIGVDVWLLNLEQIAIGQDVCVSQSAFICTGSHDAKSRSFEFDNAPIKVEDGAWIAARATVLRGVTVGKDAVVGATALVVRDVPAGSRALAPLPKQQWRGSEL